MTALIELLKSQDTAILCVLAFVIIAGLLWVLLPLLLKPPTGKGE